MADIAFQAITKQFPISSKSNSNKKTVLRVTRSIEASLEGGRQGMKIDIAQSNKPHTTEDEQKKVTNTMPHVVIVGAGFGGLEAAKRLGNAPVQVTVIDRRNYHLFQPMLYQVATARLSIEDISTPILIVRSNGDNFLKMR